MIDFGTLWDGLIAINEDDLAFIKAQIEKERQQMSSNSGQASAVQERTIGSDLDTIALNLTGLEETLSQIMGSMNVQRPQETEKEVGIPAGVTRIDGHFSTATNIQRRMSEMQTDLEHLQNELSRI